VGELLRILVVGDLSSPFVRQDYRLLSELASVRLLSAGGYLGYFAKLLEAGGYDVYYAWWASSLHNVVYSKVHGGASVVVAGGFDVVSEDSVKYGFRWQPWWKRKAVRYCLREADLILAVSRFVEEHVRRLEPKARVEVAYLGVDPERFAPASLQQRKPVILTVAHLTAKSIVYKGVVDLLEAFAHVAKRKPEARLRIAGAHRGGEATLARRAKELGLSSRVELIGEVEHSRIHRLYQEAMVYAQLSRVESFGLCVAEAMSCGTPVVVSGAGGLREVAGGVGATARPDDPEEVADVVCSLLEDRRLWLELSELSRSRILEGFTLSHRKRRLAQAMESVA